MPIKNRKAFEKDLEKAVQKYGSEKLKDVRAAAFEAYSEILMGSPVRTGRFRSNWMIGSQSQTGTVEPTVNSAKTLGQPATSTEYQKGIQAVNKLGDENTLYITNNVSYAKALENGSSTQNQGFVARAERNFRKRLQAIDDLVVSE